MLEYAGINLDDFTSYHEKVLNYRNWMVAHSDQNQYNISHYPDYTIAIKIACFYHDYIRYSIGELTQSTYSESSESICIKFSNYARLEAEKAVKASASTPSQLGR